MKKISFKRKVKGFTALGGLATVSSLVLAACADNSSTTTETKTVIPSKSEVDPELVKKTEAFVSEQMEGFKLLSAMEKTHFADLVERLNFEKGLNQTDLDSAKAKLGDKDSTQFAYDSTDHATKIKEDGVTVFGILKKMEADIKTASSQSNPTVTVDELAAFTKSVETFKNAATDLVSKFATLPKATDTSTELGTKADALTTEVNATTFSSSNLKTKMDDFVSEVKTQRTSSTTLVTAALELTKATAALESYVNTNIAKFVAANPDFSLELNTIVSLVTEKVLGTPNADLFASPSEAPAELRGQSITNLYKVFAKLFKVNESLDELTHSYQRLTFLEALIAKNKDAIELFAKKMDSLLFNVDFARLNAFLSFRNTNLFTLYNEGPQIQSQTPTPLVQIAAAFQGLETGFEYITNEGTNGLKQKLTSLKTNDSTNNNYDSVISQIATDKSKFTDAIEQVKKANEKFVKLNADIQALNSIIRSSNGFAGILQLLTKVQDIKTDISEINELFKKTSDSEDDSVILTKIKTAKEALNLAPTSGETLGKKLKALYDSVDSDQTKKEALAEVISLDTAKTNYEGGKIGVTYKNATSVETYDALLKTSASATGDSVATLPFMKELVKTSYAPSMSSETITQLTQLAAEYKAK